MGVIEQVHRFRAETQEPDAQQVAQARERFVTSLDRGGRMESLGSRHPRMRMLVVSSSLALVIAGIAFASAGRRDPGSTSVSEPTTRADAPAASGSEQEGTQGIAGAVTRGRFDPDADPWGNGREVTLAVAQAAAGYPLYLPDCAEASPASLDHVWLGVEQAGDGVTLPTVDQTEVAASYSSGILVTIVPWVYGKDAPPFSRDRNAKDYQIGGFTVVYIGGIPTRHEDAADGANGYVNFALGTTNGDALEIDVMGRVPTANLEDVAASIIKQWEAARPGA